MSDPCCITRSKEHLEGDKESLRTLVQLAAGVELFTIPLYMTALYSIPGREVKTDGYVYPFMGPTESYTLQGQYAQRAYNAVYSVYAQEMLHLQLALNICNVVGAEVNLTQPTYPPNPNDTNWIPCLGTLANVDPKFSHIDVKLGPLDSNAIDLFMAIEIPDEDSQVPPPQIPLTCPPSEIPNTTFGGIGNLYHTIEAYMDFIYPDLGNKTLFQLCYEEALANAAKAGRTLVQINQFSSPKYESYSHMTLEVSSGATATLAAGQVKDMINGIISEGEGGKRNNFNFVSPNYRPDASSEIAADALWDTYSHWGRFCYVKEYLVDHIETWDTWHKTNQWRWQDLVANPDAPTPAQKQLAEQRAKAWNDPSTGVELNNILNFTFDRFLNTLNALWNGKSNTFPMAAMRAISSRVTSVWAAGQVPEFKKPDSKPATGALHACQGLNVNEENGAAPGMCNCATAIPHTCSTTNSCASQGGCGYAVDTTGSPNYYAIKGSEQNFIPGQNSAAGNGGCGAPIPVAQLFTEQYSADQWGPLNGKPVWEQARTLFHEKNPDIEITDLTPSNVRVILPPS